MFCSYRYAYPPPDGNILTNIVNALIAVPRFDTQVVPIICKVWDKFTKSPSLALIVTIYCGFCFVKKF